MEKYISYEKMSKKQQKLVNASKRGSWGNVKPITKVKASAKVYNRKKQNSQDYGYSFGGSAFFDGWRQYEQELKRMEQVFGAGAAA